MHGFRLTQQALDDGFSGGSVKYNIQGHLFNVGEALDSGDGMIVTDDAGLAEVLSHYDALETVPSEEVPEDASPVAVFVPHYMDPLALGPVQVQTNDVPQSGTVREVVASAHAQAAAILAEEQQAAQQQQREFAAHAGDDEVAAEHQDEPGTVEEALAAGEAVSGAEPSHDDE